MPRFVLDLNESTGRQAVGGEWKVSTGLVPGEPNEGLTARLLAAPPRLADYDDSTWEVCTNVRQSLSEGFTFAWYRINIQMPQAFNGTDISGYRVFFETNFDNYGEIWVNGEIDRSAGVVMGINVPQRVEVSNSATPGESIVVACLVLNGPLAQPRGGIFMRYAYLAFEATDN